MEILGVNGEKLYSRNLGDLLRLREEERDASSSGLTLYAVLTEKRRLTPAPEPSPAESEPSDEPRNHSTRTLLDAINEERISTPPSQIDARKSWRSLTEKIRLLRRGAGGESQAAPSDDPPPDPEPTRVSLMALLAENDRQMWADSEVRINGRIVGIGNRDCNKCCVCMVRHKGAAFIPCGHTFCRQCSREVWVQRGNCPLCNNAIAEILDIF